VVKEKNSLQMKQKDLANYLLHLEDKGFKFKEDVISFIYFGKQLTGSNDYLVSISIEITLKAKKSFDGSFYLSLLERMAENKIKTKTEAYTFVEKIGLLQST